MKYIDADRLRMELEKRLKNVRDYMNGAGMKYKGPKYFKAQGKESSYDALLSIIASLQQEQPEVDLEKEINIEISKWACYEEIGFGARYDAKPFDGRDIEKIARHFYELGVNARKEE